MPRCEQGSKRNLSTCLANPRLLENHLQGEPDYSKPGATIQQTHKDAEITSWEYGGTGMVVSSLANIQCVSQSHQTRASPEKQATLHCDPVPGYPLLTVTAHRWLAGVLVRALRATSRHPCSTEHQEVPGKVEGGMQMAGFPERLKGTAGIWTYTFLSQEGHTGCGGGPRPN